MSHSYNESYLKIGDRIAGRYEVLAVVGQGSMGVVYKCRHDILGRVVAIKTLRLREHNADDRSQKRFEREARLTSRLDHPNLIGVHDFGYTANGAPYLVMDFVSGQTLFDIMKRERYLSAERAVNLFSQVCDGLFHAHQKGVIHRDLKPANILVVKNESGPETVKIVDLGVAKIVQGEESEEVEAITMIGEVCGSPIYLSPEQCLYQELDPRTDIYSLGVCLYESLMGQAPLRGATVYDTIYMHVHDIPHPFNAIAGGNPDVPRKLEEVVFRCLAKLPNDRYETMMQLKNELISSLKHLHGTSSVKVLPPESLFGSKPAQAKKSAEELPRPEIPQEQEASTHLGQSRAHAGQSQKLTSAANSAPASDNAAPSKARLQKSNEHGTSLTSPERGKKREKSAIVEKSGLNKVLLLATCGSVAFGLSVGFGFAYFLNNNKQDNRPISANPQQLSSTEPFAFQQSPQALQQPPLSKPETKSATERSAISKSATSKSATAKNKGVGTTSINKRQKHIAIPNNTVNDLSKYLPYEPPISGQGSQSKYFSIVKNAPISNTARGSLPGVARAPGFRSTQALEKLKNNPFIQRMKEFAASQGMPLSGVSPPAQNQSGLSPFLGGKPGARIPSFKQVSQTPPAELWRQGGSLLQAPDAGASQTNGSNAAQARALCSEGNQLCLSKQYSSACRKYEAAYKLNPSDPEIKPSYAYALNSQALELNNQQNYSEAVEYETRAINLLPDKELYHKNLHNFSGNLEAQRAGTLP